MLKHILVPTDGSELSQATAKRAVSFAKEAGARITVFFAKPEYPIAYFGEGALIDPTTPEKFAELAETQAKKATARISSVPGHTVPEIWRQRANPVVAGDSRFPVFCL